MRMLNSELQFLRCCRCFRLSVASLELGRDWNAARQEGVMCDVLFALHVGPYRRPGE